jgi:hypothetical protein
MKHHSYRICIEVAHFDRDQAIKKFEELYLDTKFAKWPEAGVRNNALYPFARSVVEIGPIAPSVEERLSKIEEEFAVRLGGLSEDAA